ncbi:MAG: prolyl oligopeptidase family serine peptidase, partial [Myxococcales bacterium]|nr:prolyl oligopeptidase family serine peptidase [Myxococcales bacterium]
APPFLVIHGDNDSLIPVSQARRFVAELQARSREPALYLEIPGCQHAFDVFHSVRTHEVIRGVERFLRWVHARYLAQRAGDADARTV